MSCSICQSSDKFSILENYAKTGSLRETASNFGVGYRSLGRHINKCVYQIMEEAEERQYQVEIERVSTKLEKYFRNKYKKKRPKSIIKKR